MPNCPECDNGLDIELDEVEEGDVVTCVRIRVRSGWSRAARTGAGGWRPD